MRPTTNSKLRFDVTRYSFYELVCKERIKMLAGPSHFDPHHPDARHWQEVGQAIRRRCIITAWY